jgi:hypothetical protein
MTTTSGEREALARLTAERDNIRGIADRWRHLCDKATNAAKVALDRAEAAEAEVLALRKKLAEKVGGLLLAGWWCMWCDRFNSSEKEDLTECHSCGKPKKARP